MGMLWVGYVLVDSGWHSRKISPRRAYAAAKLEKMPAVARRTLWMNIFIFSRSQWCWM